MLFDAVCVAGSPHANLALDRVWEPGTEMRR